MIKFPLFISQNNANTSVLKVEVDKNVFSVPNVIKRELKLPD